MKRILLIFLFSVGLLNPLLSHSKGCAEIDEVAELMGDAWAPSRNPGMWSSEDWSDWEKKVQTALKSTGENGDLSKQVKSLRRFLKNTPIEGSAYLEDGAEFMSAKKMRTAYRESKAGNLPEPDVTFSSIERARRYVVNHPAFKEFGFEVGDSQWTRVTGRMEKSVFYGKVVGWEKKLPNGNFARYRLDFEPDVLDPVTKTVTKKGRGLHYNLEFHVLNENHKMETIKLSVSALCGEVPCSAAQALKAVQKLNP